MTMSPVDGRLALEAASSQDLAQRKLMVDNLRDRLGDGTTKEQKLREACEGFEAIFVQKMWEQMRKTVNKEGYLHSKDEEFYQSMFDQELSKKMTSAGGIGLADMLEEQLSRRLSQASRSTIGSSSRPVLNIAPEKAEKKADSEDLYQPVPEMGEAVAQEAGVSQAPNPEHILARALEELREEREASRRIAERLPEAELVAPVAVAPVVDGAGPENAGRVVQPVLNERVSAPGKGRPSTQVRRSQARQRAAALQERDTQPQTRPMDGAGQEVGRSMQPVQGQVISSYGRQGEQGGWSTGISILAQAGAPVTAPADGTVVFAGEDERLGKLVVLEHSDGLRSFYAGAVAENIEPGDRVQAGRDFARIAAGPEYLSPDQGNFRLEVRRGELAVNPDFLLRQA